MESFFFLSSPSCIWSAPLYAPFAFHPTYFHTHHTYIHTHICQLSFQSPNAAWRSETANYCRCLQRWLEHLHSLLLSQASNCFFYTLPKSSVGGRTWAVLTTDGDNTHGSKLRAIDVTSLKYISSRRDKFQSQAAVLHMGMQMQSNPTLFDCHLTVSHHFQHSSSFVKSTCGSSIRPASIPAEYNAIPEPAPHCFSSTSLALNLRSSSRAWTLSDLLVRNHHLRCLIHHTVLAQLHGKRSSKRDVARHKFVLQYFRSCQIEEADEQHGLAR